MKTQKTFAGVLVALLVLGTAATSAAENVKLAYVDLARALQETEEGKAAMKKLTKTKNKLQKKIEKEEAQIKKMQDEIQNQRSILDQQTLQKKGEEYYKALGELQQTYMQFQRDLAAKEMQVTQEIYAKMQKIVGQIGKADGYTMIYDRSSGGVVWAPSHLDLTDKLIQKYNAKHKPKKGKKSSKK